METGEIEYSSRVKRRLAALLGWRWEGYALRGYMEDDMPG